MILDNIGIGDYIIVTKPKTDFEDEYVGGPSGEPLMVLGVSLPWVAVCPITRPELVTSVNLNYWEIEMPSEEYVSGWRSRTWFIWEQYNVAEQAKMLAVEKHKQPEVSFDLEQCVSVFEQQQGLPECQAYMPMNVNSSDGCYEIVVASATYPKQP